MSAALQAAEKLDFALLSEGRGFSRAEQRT